MTGKDKVVVKLTLEESSVPVNNGIPSTFNAWREKFKYKNIRFGFNRMNRFRGKSRL